GQEIIWRRRILAFHAVHARNPGSPAKHGGIVFMDQKRCPECRDRLEIATDMIKMAVGVYDIPDFQVMEFDGLSNAVDIPAWIDNDAFTSHRTPKHKTIDAQGADFHFFQNHLVLHSIDICSKAATIQRYSKQGGTYEQDTCC